MIFSDNLKQIRKEKDFSQEYLAERLQVSRQTIAKWENGLSTPDSSMLTAIADILGVSTEELQGTSKPSPVPPSHTATNNISAETFADYAAKFQISIRRLKRNLIGLIIVLFVILLIIFHIGIQRVDSKTDKTDLYQRLEYCEQMVQSNNDDTYRNDYYADDVSVKVSVIHPKTPHILTVELTYAPNEYQKDSILSFYLPQLKSVIEAKEFNGAFIGTVEIDAKKLLEESLSEEEVTESAYIRIEEKNTVKKIFFEFSLDNISEYFCSFQTMQSYHFDYQHNQKLLSFAIEDTPLLMTYTVAGGIHITEAYFKVISVDNQELLNCPLTVQKDCLLLSTKEESIPLVHPSPIKSIYYELIDQYGIQYRYHIRQEDIEIVSDNYFEHSTNFLDTYETADYLVEIIFP